MKCNLLDRIDMTGIGTFISFNDEQSWKDDDPTDNDSWWTAIILDKFVQNWFHLGVVIDHSIFNSVNEEHPEKTKSLIDCNDEENCQFDIRSAKAEFQIVMILKLVSLFLITFYTRKKWNCRWFELQCALKYDESLSAVIVAGNKISFNYDHTEKVDWPIDVTEGGIKICFDDLHPENELFPIVVTNDEEMLSPISVIADGIEISEYLLHHQKE